jgi:NTE family protein
MASINMNELTTPLNKIEENLTHIPFFRALSSQALTAISAKLRYIHLDHDEVVFLEGSPADSMFLMESGQVKVSTGTGLQEKIVNYLGPGNFFGEMALLLDQRRSATVTVTIDVDLWVLYKKDLDELLIEFPEIALNLTRELSRRLSDVMSEVKKRPGYSLVTVVGDQPWRLAKQIQELTKQRVALFNVSGQPIGSSVGANFQSESLTFVEKDAQLSEDDLTDTLGILVDSYDWVLMVVSPEYSEINAKAVDLSKATVLLNTPAKEWLINFSDGPIFQCDSADEKDVGRTARKITHRVVGLALSSGGARGIAHIGVLKVLEAANIPVDMIAGTSAGSLFGGLYACGKTTDEVAYFAKNLVNITGFKSGLWDPKFTLPWDGLIKGNATLKFLAKQFDNAIFADTKTPFYVVATDVLTGEEVIFEKGSVAEAVRASIGMIGIFSPYRHNGQYLIDGGAVNPVPATVLAEKGANIIIASSVIPSIEEERARGQTTSKRQRQPSFLGVLSSMMGIMEREIVRTRMSPVDVLIRPRVELYTAMDYDKAVEFIHLGEEATEKELPMLQKMLKN